MPEANLKTFAVAIAVNGTVEVIVDATDKASAMDEAEADFHDDFAYYIQKVDPKACSAEDAEEIE